MESAAAFGRISPTDVETTNHCGVNYARFALITGVAIAILGLLAAIGCAQSASQTLTSLGKVFTLKGAIPLIVSGSLMAIIGSCYAFPKKMLVHSKLIFQEENVPLHVNPSGDADDQSTLLEKISSDGSSGAFTSMNATGAVRTSVGQQNKKLLQPDS